MDSETLNNVLLGDIVFDTYLSEITGYRGVFMQDNSEKRPETWSVLSHIPTSLRSRFESSIGRSPQLLARPDIPQSPNLTLNSF